MLLNHVPRAQMIMQAEIKDTIVYTGASFISTDETIIQNGIFNGNHNNKPGVVSSLAPYSLRAAQAKGRDSVRVVYESFISE